MKWLKEFFRHAWASFNCEVRGHDNSGPRGADGFTHCVRCGMSLVQG